MAILYMNGYDDTIAEEGSAVGGSTLVTGRNGYGLGARRTTLALSTFGTLPTAKSDVKLGFAFRPSSLNSQVFLAFANAAGTSHVRVGGTASGAIELRNAANAVVATSANGVLVANSWVYLEFHVTVANSGGVIECRAGESVVASAVSDTYNSGSADISTIAMGSLGTTATDFDDLVIYDGTDAYYGDKTILTRIVNGNGSSSQWVGSDGDSTDNYLLIDETPTPSGTDYVASTTSGNKDLYAFEDMPTNWAVVAVQSTVYALKSDAGTPPPWSMTAKGALGGTRDEDALDSKTSTTVAMLNSTIYTTDPDGNPLTPSRVNAMEIGVKIT